MTRLLLVLPLFATSGCATRPCCKRPAAPEAVTEPVAAPAHPQVHASTPSKNVDERRAELLQKHNEVWRLMGLSRAAMDELDSVVVAVNAQLYKNQAQRPEEFAKAMEVKRTHEPLTYETYMAAHRRRFDLLKISEPTQTELLGAADFVWKALHDGTQLTPEQRKTAESIRDMMKSMNGPPPCCDDNIFERAKP